ncbi:hypothetical protein Dsin_026967 [Dipteronia sinensis]|uniref:TF-B3 domain-containing protein n=1 Tax=Dipteronia sinensis TaxID=43782 RepID=A0AAD9ZZ83_9ROSI|nr:hypothetical protein Dsin_026967 [Dipteronia sinensis]
MALAAKTPSHFFTIIRHSTLQDKKLGIPRVFVKKFGNELSTVATLTAPNGRIWNVELTKDGRNIWFNVGWVEFVEYHSISIGYFLLFRYQKKSTFHVLIFDMSACEIRYPHYFVERKNDNQDEIEDEDSVEIIGSLTPKPDASDFTLEINRSRKYNTSLESQIFRSGYEVRSKRHKMEEVVGLNESDSTGDDSEHELLDILEEMGIYVKINFQYITAEEKLRAIAAARLFKPKNPSFMVILRHRDIYKDNMYVPLEFSKKYFIGRDTKLIKLRDHDGKEWAVELSRYRPKGGGGDLTHGWTKFSNDKNLKEGDICMFELIRKKNIVLKVSVFHSSTSIF